VLRAFASFERVTPARPPNLTYFDDLTFGYL
jgi:hypothetical protein